MMSSLYVLDPYPLCPYPSTRCLCPFDSSNRSQAAKSDGWDTEPFELVVDEATGRLVGRGSSDDKGPVLGWLNVLQAHKDLGLPLPVNLKFCFEGMEESGSEGLDELIVKEKDGFFKGVDAVCIVCYSLAFRKYLAD